LQLLLYYDNIPILSYVHLLEKSCRFLVFFTGKKIAVCCVQVGDASSSSPFGPATED